MNTFSAPQFSVFAKRKNSKDSLASLYLKVSFQNKHYEKSLGIRCYFDDWKHDQFQISNRPLESQQLRLEVEKCKQKIMGAYYLLSQDESYFTVKDIIDVAFKERKPGGLSFGQCFQDIVTRMEKSKSRDGNSEANIQKHKRCLVHFQAFCRLNYKSTDLAFQKINRTTVEELSEYLKGEGKCSHNTAMKYMQIIKKVYRAGIDNGWVKINAFANFKFRMKTVARECLTEEELQILQDSHFEILRLEYVKNLFLFSCFTGMAYIDVKNLKRVNISSVNDRFWIKSRRTKTGVEASIPLLAPAQQIIEKYNAGWQKMAKDQVVFEIISNQKLNAYLKEISTICGIDKVITFHLARHTFATTVTLNNDIPLETVSKMLGHSRISMTQHYSKVIDKKIARDTEKLLEKYK